jgi:hypothetical protein
MSMSSASAAAARARLSHAVMCVFVEQRVDVCTWTKRSLKADTSERHRCEEGEGEEKGAHLRLNSGLPDCLLHKDQFR